MIRRKMKLDSIHHLAWIALCRSDLGGQYFLHLYETILYGEMSSYKMARLRIEARRFMERL